MVGLCSPASRQAKARHLPPCRGIESESDRCRSATRHPIEQFSAPSPTSSCVPTTQSDVPPPEFGLPASHLSHLGRGRAANRSSGQFGRIFGECTAVGRSWARANRANEQSCACSVTLCTAETTGTASGRSKPQREPLTAVSRAGKPIPLPEFRLCHPRQETVFAARIANPSFLVDFREARIGNSVKERVETGAGSYCLHGGLMRIDNSERPRVNTATSRARLRHAAPNATDRRRAGPTGAEPFGRPQNPSARAGPEHFDRSPDMMSKARAASLLKCNKLVF